MSSVNKPLVGLAIFILLIPMILLQKIIDPQRHQFEPNLSHQSTAARQLPIEFALGAMTGFREAIAGLLWVRTDEFFDQGNYDAIVPMVRIITWLDPHNIDVYETGAWHLDYNFTDTDQRSDRRYIPMAISLLEEGCDNNDTVPDIPADLAFTHYFRKIGDYPKAVEWYKKAEQIKGWDATTVGHGLAHSYQADGQIDMAIAQWKYCINQHLIKIAQDKSSNDRSMIYADQNGLYVAQKNLKETILRAKWRKIQTQPPLDAGFSIKVTRIAPMVLVVDGTLNSVGSSSFNLQTGQHTWGPVDGARVDIRLQDASYVMPASAPFTLNIDLPTDTTIMQDSGSVRNDKFEKKIDMSKDHTGDHPMYPFKAATYTLTCWFNPANPNSNPPNMADRIGWLGEGITDKKYLDTSGVIPGTQNATVPGLRLIKKTFTLTRDDIMGSGLKEFD